MTEPPAPRRVVVTNPRKHALATSRRYPVSREIDEQTELGEVFMRSLVQAQLRLGLMVCALVGCVLGGLPVLFALVPRLKEMRLLGLALPWLLLGVLVYPMLVAAAAFYIRHAEHNEQDFAELVERS